MQKMDRIEKELKQSSVISEKIIIVKVLIWPEHSKYVQKQFKIIKCIHYYCGDNFTTHTSVGSSIDSLRYFDPHIVYLNI